MSRGQSSSRARARTGLALATLLVLAGLVLAAPAAAAKSCGEQVVDDWWDNGRVDKTYPLHCYEEAIDTLPVDVKDYSSAEDDIRRALQSALAGKPDPGGKDPSPEGAPGDEPGEAPDEEDEAGGPGIGGPPDPDGGPVNQAIDNLGPSSADSIPIPLLVLAGLAVLLLAAGSVGYVSRRLQARRLPESGA